MAAETLCSACGLHWRPYELTDCDECGRDQVCMGCYVTRGCCDWVPARAGQQSFSFAEGQNKGKDA